MKPLARTIPFLLALSVALLTLLACSAPSGATQTGHNQPGAARTIIDSVGRHVHLLAHVQRVATVGSVPVLNSFPFAVGAGNTIVNGIPGGNAAGYASYTVLAPKLLNAPNVESSIGAPPNTEALLALKPDVVLTDSVQFADQIQSIGIPSVVLSLETGDKIKEAVLVTGEVLGRQQQAADYVSYFDDVVVRVRKIAQTIPENARPTVLYIDLHPLRRPNRIMEWMLDQVGARSVTHDVQIGQYKFDIEQLQQWNPDVLIGMEPNDRTGLTTDPRFTDLRAVQSGRIGIIPTGIQIWGNNTAEQPLALLWVAKYVFPQQFAHINLPAETKSFYQRYFNITLTDPQVQQLLASTL
ncbi:MAG: ABC transporter substrate-binding protein [Pseudonocardiales bacterium]|nr:ABC transporter substrate-binding protein [Pseudonocardiales bacterium]MBV9728990.1 ABC transporter substrate-binding protein [Pseudonocardiales bacterium]